MALEVNALVYTMDDEADDILATSKLSAQERKPTIQWLAR